MTITDKMVEAAARQIRATTSVLTTSGWDDISDGLKNHYRERAVAVLTAALQASET